MKNEYEFCLRCGRKLKNPDFRKIGYGKICQQKIKISGISPLFFSKKSDDPNQK